MPLTQGTGVRVPYSERSLLIEENVDKKEWEDSPNSEYFPIFRGHSPLSTATAIFRRMPSVGIEPMTSDLRNDVSNLRQIGRFSCEVMGSMPTEEKNCKIGGSCAALRALGGCRCRSQLSSATANFSKNTLCGNRTHDL